ncbi:MAG TPA: hypothetical protein EYM50_03945 [Nitrososphaerales archaeon]|nr:hypothetical protein [Nitrososphaerales archaeon]
MAELVSPGVLIKEKDLTTGVRSEATSIGAVAIHAYWGPITTTADSVVTIQDEVQLVDIYGKPDGSNFEYWFSAANFLAYGNTLKVIRILTASQLNSTGAGSGVLIPNTTSYQTGDGNYGPYSGGEASGLGSWAARFAGARGNNLQVAYCATSAAYKELGKTTMDTTAAAGATEVTMVSATGFSVGDIIYLQETNGQHYRITAIATNDLTIVRYPTAVATGLTNEVAITISVDREWRYADMFAGPPGTSTYVSDRGGLNDELHVIVIDEDGGVSGAAGTVLETWADVSKAADARTDEGDRNYYPDVLYNSSQWIYWLDHPTGATNWGTNAQGVTFTVPTASLAAESLISGADGSVPTAGNRAVAYDWFKDADTQDINLLISGPANVTSGAGTAHSTALIDIVNARKDCVVFLSPYRDAVVKVAATYTASENVKAHFDLLSSTSYAVFDSGYKKQYDKYNDVYRYVPLNGDIAGVCALTDAVEDPWWSPGGLTRGQIRGSVELAYNPNLAERNKLYRARVNPVVTFAGEGTVLWGDKTGLSQNSAFSRINVRRLFITIEEACKIASRSVLFEFNDDITQSAFRNMVNPYLRDVQARRGITDFLVVCDSSNNTPQVVDNNEFRADVYVKPARSINFITLTFIATRTGVAFSEVTGA